MGEITLGGALRVLRNLREQFPADAEVLDAYLNAMGKAIEQQAARAQDLERQLAVLQSQLYDARTANDELLTQLAAQRERDGRDAERLDYIERTFSGMTNRERYLPVQMVWGAGANGRTLREACDKYMARAAALKDRP